MTKQETLSHLKLCDIMFPLPGAHFSVTKIIPSMILSPIKVLYKVKGPPETQTLICHFSFDPLFMSPSDKTPGQQYRGRGCNIDPSISKHNAVISFCVNKTQKMYRKALASLLFYRR